ncbi:MAG: hypothetical protein Q4F00_13325 [bacterium]|nr:hypothetical protein [bacterium]
MGDHQDKIEQIRARRSRDSVQVNYNPYDSQQQQQQIQNTGHVGAAQGVNTDEATSLIDANFKSPWLRDRVSLSLEGQLAMIEQRQSGTGIVADLGYSNRNTSMTFDNGMSVKIEPPGTYRLMYNND